jgi:hypothetical protein
MLKETVIINAHPRMAAYKADLFDEIDDLKDELETLKLQKKLSMLLNALLFLLLLILGSQQVHADVFKCKLAEGGTAYQSTACPEAAGEVKVTIKKRSADKDFMAVAELAQWQAQQDAYKIALAAAKQELAAETDRRNTVIALQDTATAQQQQAVALQREADAEFERNRIKYYGINAPLISNPYSHY